MSCLYILNINHLLVISFGNISSHSIDFFCYVLGSLCCEKLLSLISSYLFVFAFISFALGGKPPKNIIMIYVKVFYLCSLLRVLWFQVLHLGF